MSFLLKNVLIRHDPSGPRLPVVFDSPHSGAHYPDDFHYVCPVTLLRQTEDAYVETLFSAAPDYGCTLLEALFARSYIDLNRAEDDIDPRLLAEPWPRPLVPSDKCLLGMGLLRSICLMSIPVYAKPLPVSQITRRITQYYRPYHAQLATTLNECYAHHGAVWHLNCHSMPSQAVAPSAADRRPRCDFALGDRDGTTSDPALVALIKERLQSFGYHVRLNDPYKGMELIRRYADPSRHRYSLQIEINRALYMNEDTLERTPHFTTLQRHLTQLIESIASYAGQMLQRRAAE